MRSHRMSDLSQITLLAKMQRYHFAAMPIRIWAIAKLLATTLCIFKMKFKLSRMVVSRPPIDTTKSMIIKVLRIWLLKFLTILTNNKSNYLQKSSPPKIRPTSSIRIRLMAKFAHSTATMLCHRVKSRCIVMLKWQSSSPSTIVKDYIAAWVGTSRFSSVLLKTKI